MTHCLLAVALAVVLSASPAESAGLTGKYIEARTCDIWTGPCYANAEMHLAGKHAVIGWKIDRGRLDNVSLDGLSVVAVVAARDTLGCRQTGKARAIVIVDDRATTAQRDALVKLARKQGGELVAQVVHVEAAPIELDLCPCKEDGCAVLTAGKARIETRCLNVGHDKVCGNESAFYPPLTGDVTVKPAMAVEHTYAGKGAGARWSEANRRGAYLGSFAIR